VYLNRGKFRTHGIEVTLTWRPLSDLALFAGTTWLQADPADTPYAPRWSASMGATWRFLTRFTWSVDGSFVDEQLALSRDRTSTAANASQVDRYFLLGARLGYELPLPWNAPRAELFIAGENLTGANYEYKPGYPMPGINGMGGIRVRF
jgi:iron complex outermembrane receptor protein